MEAIFCGKPVLNYANPNEKIFIDGKVIDSPFLPKSNDPKEIAKIIDEIVSSEVFRNELFHNEQEIVKEISDPIKSAEWWDELFMKKYNECGGIRKESSLVKQKLRMALFLIGNRFYLKKRQEK